VAVVAPRIADTGALSLLLIFAVWLLSGCANPGRPPVVDRSPVFSARPESYVVRAGDTLYSIAWRYELDVAGLARANGLHDPYTIYVGQRLRLREQLTRHASPAPGPVAPKPTRSQRLSWSWPVSTAAIAREFSGSNKGIDFRLERGDYVRAAAAGEVVYAGNGLGGYVHLVIVKHNDHFLSAYSFNSVGGVREGKQVKAGENLARVVAAARDSRILHFEIRRDGRAVDPRTVIGR